MKKKLPAALITSIALCLLTAYPSNSFAGSIVAWGNVGTDPDFGQLDVPDGRDFVAISAGAYHNIALKLDGSLVGWGLNEDGQCDVPEGNDFVKIAAGGYHNLAIKADGSVVGWGSNFHGQASVPSGTGFVAIAVGRVHSMALKSDGSLVAWGQDYDHQVSDLPVGTDFVQIASGDYHCLAIKSDGSLVTWGYDRYGQVTNTPEGTNFVEVSAGHGHSLALKDDGSVVIWGSPNSMVNPTSVDDFVSIAASGYHNIGLRTDGSIVAWGNNLVGQCNWPAGNNFVAVGSGDWHSIALLVNDLVEFTDANLKAAVEEELGQENPNTNDMLGLVSLDAASCEITSLRGLEFAGNLSHLSLNSNKITSIEPIAGLSNLTFVALSYNRIELLPDLSSWANINNLYLQSNSLNDIEPLVSSGITKLEHLNIDMNEVLPVEAYRDYIPSIRANNPNLVTFRYDYGCKPMLPGDLNNDCSINLADFAIMASEWLRCTHMYQVMCP